MRAILRRDRKPCVSIDEACAARFLRAQHESQFERDSPHAVAYGVAGFIAAFPCSELCVQLRSVLQTDAGAIRRESVGDVGDIFAQPHYLVRTGSLHRYLADRRPSGSRRFGTLAGRYRTLHDSRIELCGWRTSHMDSASDRNRVFATSDASAVGGMVPNLRQYSRGNTLGDCGGTLVIAPIIAELIQPAGWPRSIRGSGRGGDRFAAGSACYRGAADRITLPNFPCGANRPPAAHSN